jgi:putative beta-lysine N-acetyltransferase
VTKEIINESARITLYSDPLNKRIRIDDYEGEISDVYKLIKESTSDWVEKVIVKSREPEISFFESKGFIQEAFIKGYFNGIDMYFLVRYLNEDRKISNKFTKEESIINDLTKEKSLPEIIYTSEVTIATESDADELTSLYSKIFKVYPTPISEPGYVLKTMKEGTLYVCIRQNGKIVSAASAEINNKFSNAELTDCATLPETQGQGHMKKLLKKLEELMVDRNIKCLYTIARAESTGMNKVFHQLQYMYSGRMINNCYIYSGLEDMNVWFKLINK